MAESNARQRIRGAKELLRFVSLEERRAPVRHSTSAHGAASSFPWRFRRTRAPCNRTHSACGGSPEILRGCPAFTFSRQNTSPGMHRLEVPDSSSRWLFLFLGLLQPCGRPEPKASAILAADGFCHPDGTLLCHKQHPPLSSFLHLAEPVSLPIVPSFPF